MTKLVPNCLAVPALVSCGIAPGLQARIPAFPGGDFDLLASTNVALPRSNWTYVNTYQFDANGNFSLTNPPGSTGPRYFYLIETQP